MSVYPRTDFLTDLAAWKTTLLHLPGSERAKVLFSMRYPKRKAFAYRFNRFVCIMQAVHGDLPALVHDRIAIPDGGSRGGAFVPEDLLLALHQWYCSLSEQQMECMPDPNWSEVMPIYDDISDSTPNA